MENERLSPVRFEHLKGDEAIRLNDDMPEDVPIIEKRHRRRSSVFAEVRKSLQESRKANESNGPNLGEEAQITMYIGHLRKEKKEWLGINRKRKSDYEDAYRKYSNHSKERRIMTEKECLQYLDEIDMKYLRDLPKFKPTAMKYQRLAELQKLLKAGRRKTITVAMGLLNLIRQDIEAEKQNIIIYSDIQPL